MSTFLDISQGVAKGRTGKIMSGGQIVDAVSNGTPIITNIVNSSETTLSFANWGDIAYRLLLNQNTTISLSGGNTGELQKMTLVIQQPMNGGCEVTLPDTINFDKAVFIDSRIGSVSILEIIWDGAQNYYGRIIYG